MHVYIYIYIYIYVYIYDMLHHVIVDEIHEIGGPLWGPSVSTRSGSRECFISQSELGRRAVVLCYLGHA